MQSVTLTLQFFDFLVFFLDFPCCVGGIFLSSEWPRFGSVRLRFGGGTIRAVPVFGSTGSSTKRVCLCFGTVFIREDGSGSGFGSWKTVPAVPVPLPVSGKTVLTVPVSGSGSVPEPPCFFSKDVRGSAKRKTLTFFGVSLAVFFQQSKGWRVRAPHRHPGCHVNVVPRGPQD